MPVATQKQLDTSRPVAHRASTARHEVILTIEGRDSPNLLAATLDCARFNGYELEQLDRHHRTDGRDARVIVRMTMSGLPEVHEKFVTDFAGEIAGPFDVTFRLRPSSQLTRVGILVSKETHCMRSMIENSANGQLPVNIVAVLSNHLDAEWEATSAGLPFHYIPTGSTSRSDVEQRHLQVLANNVDLVILARYMRILSSEFLDRVGVPVINIHHSLLPAFPGASPHRRAKERGVKLIGATAHYATAELDEGPIIEQNSARVTHRHSLDDIRRISGAVESDTLVSAVRAHCEDRVFVGPDQTTVVF